MKLFLVVSGCLVLGFLFGAYVTVNKLSERLGIPPSALIAFSSEDLLAFPVEEEGYVLMNLAFTTGDDGKLTWGRLSGEWKCAAGLHDWLVVSPMEKRCLD
jgi:hypothetical protein